MTPNLKAEVEVICGPASVQALWRAKANRAELQALARRLREMGLHVIAATVDGCVERQRRIEELLEVKR